jgi:Putative peptidoglycan binding domain/N-acetylmuramoyl-L-alanine amidase
MSFTAQVVTTDKWGARQAGPFSKTVPRYIVIHHTDNKNPPNDPSKGTKEGAKQLAQDIQRFHMDSRGWSDSGHNFLNTTGGIILEGRHGSLEAVMQGMCVQSAHAKQDPGRLANGNQSPGIENEGNFMTFNMGHEQWTSLVDLCASICESCNISPNNIRGHRDFSNTDCPGDWLYSQLPQLQADVAKKLGQPIIPIDSDLELGSTGPSVIQLQQRLLSKGFSPGAIDGIFGDNTKQAVIQFQRSTGLKDDGIVGPSTLASLGI